MKKYLLAGGVSFAAFSIPFLALADEKFVSLSGIPAFQQLGDTPNLSQFLNQLYLICIGAAVVIAVLQIIRAGIMYSMGDSGFAKIEEAKHLILVSLLGLLLVLSPYIVFSIINPAILSLKIDTSGIQVTGDGTALPSTNQGAPDGDVVSCKDYTQGIAINKPADCSVHGSDFVAAPNSCCSVVNSNQTCCARPTASQTAYAWAGQYSISSGQPGGSSSNQILSGGPFATQAACYADAGNVSARYPGKTVTLTDPPGLTCKCDTPASGQGNACQSLGF